MSAIYRTGLVALFVLAAGAAHAESANFTNGGRDAAALPVRAGQEQSPQLALPFRSQAQADNDGVARFGRPASPGTRDAQRQNRDQ